MDNDRNTNQATNQSNNQANSQNDNQAPYLISMEAISKSYRGNNGTDINILTQADFHIKPGETLAIVGASGIGKSTLLHILGTLDRPDAGQIYFKGEDILSFDPVRLAGFRNVSVGFVFQFHHLLPEFTAMENVMMPGLIAGMKKQDIFDAADAILKRVGLAERIGHRVTDLSGGEQQRVALARALVLKPAMLLADEPTGNLDRKNSEQIHHLLMELNKEFGMTLVVVTHSPDLAAYLARRVTITEGKVVESS